MKTLVVSGGFPLKGELAIAGAKNVALKACVAALLTDEELILHNVPRIQDVYSILEVLKSLGVRSVFKNHTLRVSAKHLATTTVPIEIGASLRASSLAMGPLIARYGQANIPNPGGCRIGARPIDRQIDGLRKMGANILYNSTDGYFHATASRLSGTDYTFTKNTHTGTEALLLAAVLAKGRTILSDAAQEVEVDDLISVLSHMGAKIKRTSRRQIVVDGVDALHGTEYTLMPDRNEEVTFAIAAAITGGEIMIHNSQRKHLDSFLHAFRKAGAWWKPCGEATTKYWIKGNVRPTIITTAPYPGFMTDWQGPWAVLMTQAFGNSTIHETVFENRFSYVSELMKMGANIEFFDPTVKHPEEFYNFNWEDHKNGLHQGILIHGPTKLHNAVVEMRDLRAGATLVLAALAASGTTYIHGIEHIDRGYEKIEERLTSLGASIRRVTRGDGV